MKERNEEIIDSLNYLQQKSKDKLGESYVYSMRFNPVEVTENGTLKRIETSVFPKIEALPENERVEVWQKIDGALTFWKNYAIGNKQLYEDTGKMILICKLIAAGYTNSFIGEYLNLALDQVSDIYHISQKTVRFLFENKILSTSSDEVNSRLPNLSSFDNDLRAKRVFNIYMIFTQLPEIIENNSELNTLVEKNPHLEYFLNEISTGRSIDDIAEEHKIEINKHYKSRIINYIVYGKGKITSHALLKDLVLAKFLNKQQFYLHDLSSDEIGYVINTELINLLNGYLIKNIDMGREYNGLGYFIEMLPYIHMLLIREIEQTQNGKFKGNIINRYFVNYPYSDRLKPALPTRSYVNKNKSFAINYLSDLGNAISPALLFLADASLSTDQVGIKIATQLKDILEKNNYEFKFDVETLKNYLKNGQGLVVNTLLMNPNDHRISIKDQLLYKRHQAITEAMKIIRNEIVNSNIELYETSTSEEE
jgi:hypothetical protein